MKIVDVHHDETIYPNSHSFISERWLNSPKTENGSSLDRCFVSFGKGSRSRLGIKYVSPVAVQTPTCRLILQALAHAEMYLVLAALFRRFTFE
jgi:hypothetical protein